MKKLKTLSIICLFLISTSLFAQDKDVIDFKKDISSSIKYTINDDILNFKGLDFTKNLLSFDVYNDITKLNDSFLLTHQSIFYTRSNPVFENDFRVRKIDSFNPYGADGLCSFLVYGVIGKFFNIMENR